MKKFILFICIFFALTSCSVQKKITVLDVKNDSVTTKNVDTVLIKTRLVNQDSIKAKVDIDLNSIDIFKKYYTEDKPYTVYDSTGQIKVETFIDKDNHLKQKVITKPKPIPVTDTTKISKHETKEVKSEVKNTTIIEEKQPSFFEKVWSTIKSFIWFIVIAVIGFIFYKLNIIGFIKKIFI